MNDKNSAFSMDDFNTIHDFNEENLAMMVVGCYVILTKPFSYFLLNVCHLVTVLLVYIFLIAMAVITIVRSSDAEKALVVQTLQALCLMLCGLALPGTRLATDDSMTAALDLIRRGVYHYPGDVRDEKHSEIRSEKVSEIRALMYWVSRMTFFCAFSNTFVMPSMKYLTSGAEDARGASTNPYLPLPVYMPFDTNTPTGFASAFLLDGIFFFFLYATIACLVETYLSCALQLIAQLEILSHSLRNVERRARLKTLREQPSLENAPLDLFYERPDFHRHLYDCLRENIIHHHLILRLMKAISPFLEGINSISILSFSIVLAASVILIAENPSINVALIGTLLSDVICYYQMCKVGQDITDKSVEISDALYTTPWPSTDKKFAGLLKIMLANTQRPIVIKARGFNASASLETYGDMISAGYKIINILR